MEMRYCSSDVKHRVDFSSLDPYIGNLAMGTKQTTIAQRYSNPEYFLNQWCMMQVARMKQLEKEKRQQKLDKKARKKQRVGEGAAGQPPKAKRKSSINWQERCASNITHSSYLSFKLI